MCFDGVGHSCADVRTWVHHKHQVTSSFRVDTILFVLFACLYSFRIACFHIVCIRLVLFFRLVSIRFVLFGLLLFVFVSLRFVLQHFVAQRQHGTALDAPCQQTE